MLMYAVFFGAGLIVGWNLLPQPEWVERLYMAVKRKLFRRA